MKRKSTSKINNKISVVIVTYNSAKYVNNLIKSLNLIQHHISEILIIDNNSQDVDQITLSSGCTLIKQTDNLGFAKAANIGIKKSKNDLILLINPDCLLKNKSIIKTINKIQINPKIGIIGGKIIDLDSKQQRFTANSKATFLTGLFEFTNLKKIFPNNKFSKKFWIENKYSKTKEINVNALCGAYLIIRKYLKGQINLFDERYFLYLEDMDIGDKVNKLGYKVVFDPNSEILHVGGASSNSKYKIVLPHWYNSRKQYFKKHLKKWEFFILNIVFTLEEKILEIYHKIKGEPYV